jgi:hypothetical protein
MTTWDLFIFVAGPCFVSSMLCPNHRYLRYNLSCLSHRIVYLDTIVLSFLIFRHHFISLAYLIIHARALTCTQQRQFSVQLVERERVSDINGGRQDCCAASDCGSDHLRLDPDLSCTEAPPLSTRRRSTLVDKRLSCSISLHFLCIRGLFNLIHTPSVRQE